jgi:hypothetical protein
MIAVQLRAWITFALLFSGVLPLVPPGGTVLPKGWTLEGQNYILRPKQDPVAVVHFIGGAGAQNFATVLFEGNLSPMISATTHSWFMNYFPIASSQPSDLFHLFIESFSNLSLPIFW